MCCGTADHSPGERLLRDADLTLAEAVDAGHALLKKQNAMLKNFLNTNSQQKFIVPNVSKSEALISTVPKIPNSLVMLSRNASFVVALTQEATALLLANDVESTIEKNILQFAVPSKV